MAYEWDEAEARRAGAVIVTIACPIAAVIAAALIRLFLAGQDAPARIPDIDSSDGLATPATQGYGER